MPAGGKTSFVLSNATEPGDDIKSATTEAAKHQSKIRNFRAQGAFALRTVAKSNDSDACAAFKLFCGPPGRQEELPIGRCEATVACVKDEQVS
jgi:hypothetical protein